MLELRADFLKEINEDILRRYISEAKNTGLKIIFTCRDPREGGKNNYTQQARLNALLHAVSMNVDYIDCEAVNFKNQLEHELKTALNKSQTRLILSAHDFHQQFDNLEMLYEEIITLYPEAVVKIVYTAEHINDCFAAFDLLRENPGSIIMCMGQAGQISRLICKKLGGLVSYMSLDEASASAPGQLTLQDAKSLYRWDSIDADTEFYGVIGDPVAHSMSPAIFNACFEHNGANSLYLPIHVQGESKDLSEFLENVSSRPWLGFRGFSVTIPHKTAALSYVRGKGEYIEPLAENIGALNTLKVGFGGIITGYNTDCEGAMRSLTSAMKIDRHGLHQKHVAVIGAGGVARAIVAGLADVGAHITIYNRTADKAKRLADVFKCKSAPLEALADMNAEVIINCTSLGMHPDTDSTPLPQRYIKKDMLVFDTIYNPLETRLLKEAKAAGAAVISGVEMFIYQAMAQHEIFTSAPADEKVMRQAVFNRLAAK